MAGPSIGDLLTAHNITRGWFCGDWTLATVTKSGGFSQGNILILDPDTGEPVRPW
jgi:hypothetical protein